MEPAYTFDYYAVADDARDLVGRQFPNKAELVKAELWVSLPCTTLLNTSHSLDILEILNRYIMSICRISSDARQDLRTGWLWWLAKNVKTHERTTLRGMRPGRHNIQRGVPWNEGHQS
jgi:hypothetical protein